MTQIIPRDQHVAWKSECGQADPRDCRSPQHLLSNTKHGTTSPMRKVGELCCLIGKFSRLTILLNDSFTVMLVSLVLMYG